MNKSHLLLILTFALISLAAQAQKLGSRNMVVEFKAGASIEKIEAVNRKGVFVIDLTTGKVEAAVLIKGFHFESALMEEHFNENYMESDKYPRATFAGTVDLSNVSLSKDGTYKVPAKGKLTMHGVSRDVEAIGSLVVAQGKASSIKGNFSVRPEDFNIAIPGVVRNKIAQVVNITLEAPLGSI